MSLVERFVDLATGVRLAYVEQGDPAGVPVVLLHGVTDSWRSFEPVMEHLPRSMRVFAPTQRGHGGSGRPTTGYRYDDFAADVAAFLEAFAIPAAVIVGHSMGSAVAQRFAIDHPERTRGLVLMGSFADLRGNADVRAMWDTSVSKLEDPVDPGFVRAFQESTLAQPVPAAFFEMAVAESLRVPARVWRSIFAAFLAEELASDRPRIVAPTLVVGGALDSLCPPREQFAVADAIPGSRVVIYEGAGHAMHWEDPARFAADLVRFVAPGPVLM